MPRFSKTSSSFLLFTKTQQIEEPIEHKVINFWFWVLQTTVEVALNMNLVRRTSFSLVAYFFHFTLKRDLLPQKKSMVVILVNLGLLLHFFLFLVINQWNIWWVGAVGPNFRKGKGALQKNYTFLKKKFTWIWGGVLANTGHRQLRLYSNELAVVSLSLENPLRILSFLERANLT
jgi:hypothetical protein